MLFRQTRIALSTDNTIAPGRGSGSTGRPGSGARRCRFGLLVLASLTLATGASLMPRQALAQSAPATQPAGASNAAIYAQAEADFKSGNLDQARVEFQTLVDAGYKAPASHESPAQYIKDVDAREAAQAAQQKADQAHAAYVKARAEYNKGDWNAARPDFVTARDLGYKPGLFEDSPQTYLTRMDVKEAADKKANDEALAKAQAAAQAKPATGGAPAGGSVGAGMVAGGGAAASGAAPAPATNPGQQFLQATLDQEQLTREQKAIRARTMVDEAQTAYDAGHKEEALTIFTDAVSLDPNNQAAIAGRDKVARELGRSPAGGTQVMPEVAKTINEERQAIDYQINSALTAANTDIKNKDWAAAQKDVDSAEVARNMDVGIFSTDQIGQYDRNIAVVRQQLATAQAEDAAAAKQRALDQATQIEQERIARQREQREQQIQSLIQTANNDLEDERYEDALGVINQILDLDPRNEYAKNMHLLVQDKAILMHQKTYHEEQLQNFSYLDMDAEEKKIPYRDILRYPSDWPTISELRDKEQQTDQAVTEQELSMLLNKPLPEINFPNQGLATVIDFFRDTTGANIYVNWNALSEENINPLTPVNTRLHDIPFHVALDTVLSSAGGRSAKLGYTTHNSMIDISTMDEINTHTITRTYDIRDILMSVPDFGSPTGGMPSPAGATMVPGYTPGGFASSGLASPMNAMSNPSGPVVGPGGFGPAGGYSNGSGLAGGYPSSGPNEGIWGVNASEGGMSRQQVADALMHIIYAHVEPNTWIANGGVVGSLSELQGDLIATTTPQSHAEITGLLQQLRAQRSVEVTVEARFLTIERNFMEDVGLDLNFAFNFKNPNHISPINVNDATSGFTAAPETAAPDTIGGAAQGLTTAITYMDDFEVSALIRAVQATDTNTIVTAPRVTLFNGQSAAISVNTTTYFVQTLVPIVAAGGSVAYQPSVSSAPSGSTLNITATVSADHKYVTLTMTPNLTSLEKLVNFTYQTATTSTSTGSGITSVAPSETIQEPVIESAQVGTTVTVPDGGTILLGGQTIAGESVREAGVPVLDKIPFLKRLFSNHSEAKDEQVLLILVKPTILIQDEVENKQFPTLSTKTGG